MVWPLFMKKKYQKIVIHTNNLEEVKAIQDANLTDSSLVLLWRIYTSLQAIQNWKIKHILREKNQVVDHIVKMTAVKSIDMQIFKELIPILEINIIAKFDRVKLI